MKNLVLVLVTLGLILSLTVAVRADNTPAAPPKDSPAAAAFGRFQSLAGDWVAKVGDAEIGFSYKVVAQGSVVMETLTKACCDEMVTMYHMDKGSLVLTHYCALGNQPHMKAEPVKDPNVVAFTCTGGTNLESEGVPHMHAAQYTFIDHDHIKAAWTLYQDGKAAGVHEFELTRKATK